MRSTNWWKWIAFAAGKTLPFFGKKLPIPAVTALSILEVPTSLG